jgi:hydrogenase small subunit
MTDDSTTLLDALAQRGVSRRQFIKFCGAVAALLSLPSTEIDTIAKALAVEPRLPVVWLEFQDCTGDSESFLRAARQSSPLGSAGTQPSISDLVLDVLSVDYHETLMVPAGASAEKSRADTLRQYNGRYVCVVEGSIPTGLGGAYCTIGGRSALDIVREVTSGARATIALGTCASDGGLAAALPNPTGATGVQNAVPGLQNLVKLPGCPANVVNLVATIVYVITYGNLPRLTSFGRPSFAYGEEVHEHCPRKEHYEEERFVLAWGDEGHRRGWCLRKMGCRGPDTDHNCPRVRWVEGTSWPVAAGHGCVGCSEAGFWDRMTPFYASQSGDDDEHDD